MGGDQISIDRNVLEVILVAYDFSYASNVSPRYIVPHGVPCTIAYRTQVKKTKPKIPSGRVQ